MVRHTEIRLELSNSKYIDYSILRNNMQLLHKTPKKSRTKFVNVWLFALPVPVDKPTKGINISKSKYIGGFICNQYVITE